MVLGTYLANAITLAIGLYNSLIYHTCVDDRRWRLQLQYLHSARCRHLANQFKMTSMLRSVANKTAIL